LTPSYTRLLGVLVLFASGLGASEPIPLRMAAYFLDERDGRLTRTLVVYEVKVDGLALAPRDGRLAGELDTAVTVTARDTGRRVGAVAAREPVHAPLEAHGRNVWARLTRELDLPPGVVELRIRVRDAEGREGEIAQSLDVPETDGWHLSTPIVSDTSVADPRVSAQHHAVPGVLRVFMASAVLYGEVEIFGSTVDTRTRMRRVSLGCSVLRGGRIERALPPALVPVSDQRAVAWTEMSLAGLKPGDYELLFQVTDEVARRTQERRVAFTVVRPPVPTQVLYEDVLRDFRDEGDPEALRAIAGWPPSTLADPARALVAAGGLHRAAILLHSEAALALLSHGRGPAAALHLAIAREIAQRLEGTTPFRETWLTAMGSELQVRWQEALALELFVECRTAFPRAALAWLGEGTVYEFSAFPSGIGATRVVGGRESLARDAERAYRGAITIDPSLLEARVRLGRVLARQGRTAEAWEELGRVTKEGGKGTASALAHLFLGETEEAAGAEGDALRDYRAALEAEPSLQPAAIALSALLVSRGDRAAGIDALRRPLQHGCPVGLPPWLAYHVGLGAHPDQSLSRLRAQVRS
jgi:tetratricopeptide (TPR) repeat protein